LIETQESPNPNEEPRHAAAARTVVGSVTAIAGVGGLLASAAARFVGIALPGSVDALLPTTELSALALAGLSLAAVAGSILWLRGAASGLSICSGIWAIFAALIARPALRFDYSAGGDPIVVMPGRGASAAGIVAFAVAAAFAAVTHTLPHGPRGGRARPESTAGEWLAAAVFLVSGLSVSMRFYADAASVGPPAYEHALIPCLVAAMAFEALGLGLLLGFVAARALSIAVLLAMALGALFPDLFLDRLHVQTPLFWAPVAVAGAASLLIPRKLREGHPAAAPLPAAW
jgi:hypothetical protein